jgi:hypothetical protein
LKVMKRGYVGVVAAAAFAVSATVGFAGCGGGTGTSDATISDNGVSADVSASGEGSAADSYWDSCRKGKSNCEYPGECHDYVDSNGDKICDRSQPDPDGSASVETLADATSAGQLQSGACPLGPCSVCQICMSL